MWRDMIALLLFCLATSVSLFEFFNREFMSLKIFPLIIFIYCSVAIGAIIKDLFKKRQIK